MRSLAFDYAVSICCVWVVSGIFLDVWAHGHVPVESFFTPYHEFFYAGIVALFFLFAAFVIRNHRAGAPWRESLPEPYRLAAVGFPIFIAAGIGDYFWHLILGLETGVDALLSPTHQALGLGMFFIASGPIRSVLGNRMTSTTLARQLPFVIGLVAWYGLVRLGSSYAFDPGAARAEAPPPIVYSPHLLTVIAIGYYKLTVGVLVVIYLAALASGFALWAVSRMKLRPGAFTILYPCVNAMATAPFTNDTSLLAVTLIAAFVTGIAADIMVARMDPQPERPSAYRWFAVLVPVISTATLLLGTRALAGGVWWDWNISLGAICWAAIVGFGLSFIGLARRA